MRIFTKKFGSYTIAQCEKKFKKDFLDFINIGNLSISKMIMLIQMGNGTKGNDFAMSEQEAGKLIDEFYERIDFDNMLQYFNN